MKLTTIKIQKQKLERWKTIEDYPNYMISSLGRVKSLERRVGNGKGFRIVEEKILKPRIIKDGYLQVTLYKNGKRKMFLVHRLVALAFIPNPDNKPCIDHIDTNPSNNSIKNLRWVTSKENNNNPLSLKKKSENHADVSGGNSPVARKVKCIETNQIFNTLKEASEWCGLKSGGNIASQIQGKIKSAGKHPITKEKLHWEYIDEETIETNLNIFTSNISISL